MSDRLIALSTSLMIAGMIFLLDAFFLPLAIGAGVCYVAAVLFSMFSPRRSDIILVALICIILAVVAAMISRVQHHSEVIYLLPSRCLAAFAIIATAMTGWSRKGFENRLSLLNFELSERADTSDREVEAHQERLTMVELDLDEKKIAEREYRHKIARYRSLIEALPLNVFQKDADGKLRFGNLRYFETLGLTPEESIGKTDVDLFPSEQAEKYRADDLQVVKEGKTIEMIEEHVLKSGEKLYVQVFKTPVYDDENNIVGSQGMFWDVTARILAEQSQQQTDMRFRRLVKSNILGIAWTKFDGRILDANEAYLDMVGYTMEDVVNGVLNWRDMTPPEYAVLDEELIERTKIDSYCEPVEKEYLHRNGRRVPVLIGTALLEQDEFICFILDISKQKENERELKQARDEADSANRSKSLFLANMSHEVRTPLNAIIGMTEIVLDSPLNRDQSEYLTSVVNSGEALLAIINDVLDFSKVEAGKLKLEPHPFNLRETLAGTMKSMAVRAHAKDLELVFDIEASVPETLVGDVGRVRQVLTNLIGNAVKFTEQGEIVVSAVVLETAGDDIIMQFSVADTGIGVTKENQKHIFGAFEQADNTSTRVYGGTGLGLAICRSLVELMGGKIWIESEPNVGSTFHFTVKLQSSPTAGEPKAPTIPDGGRVLICDDNQTAANCLAAMMLRWNLAPTVVLNLDSALESYQAAIQSDDPFQIALIDSSIPNCDSFELLKQIIDSEDEICRPVMMLNSQSASEDAAKCEAAANTPYLLKPIGPSDLFDAVSMLLSNADFHSIRTFAGQMDDEVEIKMPPLRVLLAEDSVVNQKLVLGILDKYDQDVVLANNGLEAVDAFETHQHDKPFDVVLMDVQMPEMDGLTATRRIREIESGTGARVPIIAMTAHAMSGDRERCLEAGMDEYISKPIRIRKFVELFAAVSKDGKGAAVTVSPKETVSEKAAAVSDTHPEMKSPGADSNGDTIDSESDEDFQLLDNESSSFAPEEASAHIDIKRALQAVNDDMSLLSHLVEAFNEESPRLLSAMQEALDNHDAAGLRHNAHTLKGSMRLFGADRAYHLAFQLETCKDEKLAESASILEELVTEINAVTNELQMACN